MESFKSYLMLLEGYKEARKKWLAKPWGANTDDIDECIANFKELVKKNQIHPPENDIGYWENKPLPQFISVVRGWMAEYGKKNLKKKANKDDYPILFENDDVVVYDILSKAAACKLGSNMPWCLAKENQDYYEWHVDHGYDIKFVIDKSDSAQKMCYIQNTWKYSIWDWNNNSISDSMFFSWLEKLDIYQDDDNGILDELFPCDVSNETPDYDVPLGEDDDGEWSGDDADDWEAEEEVNENFTDGQFHFNVHEFRNQVFDQLYSEWEYLRDFIEEYLSNMIENSNEVYDGLAKLLNFTPVIEAQREAELQIEFEESTYYTEFLGLIQEEMRDFLVDEMEGEIESHPHTEERNIYQFIKARMSMFKTYKHIVLPMIKD
jgi:hypothetical protein